MGEQPLRVAILGCGAVVERCHLPASRNVPGLEIVMLVDRDLARARQLAAQHGIRTVREDYHALFESVDAVLIALPNRLHAPVAIECLKRGVAVLVEKPMAMDLADARAMCEATDGTVLQVALMKRFARGAMFIKQALDTGLLGTVQSFSIDWGVDFNWPLVSNSGMVRGEAGGGVLMDFGSHLLDLLCWWLGDAESVDYSDDARGGIEADCELTLGMTGASGRVAGTARFSRIRGLQNVVRIVGDRMTVEWRHETPDAISVSPTRWAEQQPVLRWDVGAPQTFGDLFRRQWEGFVGAVSQGLPCPVPADAVLSSMTLIQRCYEARRPLVSPWDRPIQLPREATP